MSVKDKFFNVVSAVIFAVVLGLIGGAYALQRNVANQTVCALMLTTGGVGYTTGTTTVYYHPDGTTQTSDGTATHAGNGVWCRTLSSGATNFEQVKLLFLNTGAVNVYRDYETTGYDRSAATVPANVTTMAAGVVTSGTLATGAITADAIAASAITSSEAPALAYLDTGVSTRADGAVWTSGKAAYLDTGVSTRAAAGTALSNAVWTDAKAAFLDTGVTTRAPAATALTNATWTDAKAAFLDTGVTTRAPSATALSNAVWTDAKAAYLDTGVSSVMAELDEIKDDGVATYDRTTDSLQAQADAALDGAALVTLIEGSTVLAKEATVGAVKTTTDKLDTGLVLDGAVWQWTINALENGPSGTGSTPSAIVDEIDKRHGYGPYAR